MQQQNLQCQICLDKISYEDVGPLQCGHIFHRLCIHQHLKSSVQQNNINVSCPMQGCPFKLTINDIRQYLDGQLFEKYQKFTMNKYVEMNNQMTSWCPTAGCSVIFQYDQLLDNFRCPSCKKHYCLKCRCDYHYGMTCAQYRINNNFSQNDQKFVQYIKGAKYKQCPKCKFWVQRSQGCSSMSCRCGQQFCYDCGGTGCPHGKCSGSGNKKK